MKNFNLIITLTLAMLAAVSASGYHTISSGNFSNPATWYGGNVPPYNGYGEYILISKGDSVTLDVDLLHSDLNLDVYGKLVQSGNHFISINNDGFDKVGIYDSAYVKVDSIYIQSETPAQTTIGKDTRVICEKIAFGEIIIRNYGGNIAINKRAYIFGPFIADTNTITGAANLEVIINGGYIQLFSTVPDFGPSYTVRYIGDSTYTYGLELKGPGLKEVEINLAANNSLKTFDNISLNCSIKFSSGILDFFGYNIKIDSDAVVHPVGSMKMTSTYPGELHIRTANISPLPAFLPPNNILWNLVVDNNSKVTLSSDLVLHELMLETGKLDIANNTLTFADYPTFGIPHYNKYIMMDGGGQVVAAVPDMGPMVIPIGTKDYILPVYVRTNVPGNPQLGIRLSNEVLANGDNGNKLSDVTSCVKNTWTFIPSGGSGTNFSIRCGWIAESEVNGFVRDSSYLSSYSNNAWNKIATTFPNIIATTDFQKPTYYYAFEMSTNLARIAIFDHLSKVTIGDQPATLSTTHAYPNPANGFIKLGVSEKTQAAIYNAMGQQVITSTVDANNNTINTSQLPAGVYHIRLGNGSTAGFLKQ